MIDTHSHLDGEEFRDDIDEVIARAKAVGVTKVFVPGIDAASVDSVMMLANRFPGYIFPMIGLHPEEVKSDWHAVLQHMYLRLLQALKQDFHPHLSSMLSKVSAEGAATVSPVIAIGEVGLDFYWSREYAAEQLEAFETQVRWSVDTRLPLMIHCRKAQNELVKILRKYESDLPGGVFHCFTGNAHEAEELLTFDRFALGIGGVLTFKKSPLPEVLPAVVPLDRIVLETDSPYMAPVPYRGKRNESAYVAQVAARLAESYGVDVATITAKTDANVHRIFGV